MQGAFAHDAGSEIEAFGLAAELNATTGARPPAEVKTQGVSEQIDREALLRWSRAEQAESSGDRDEYRGADWRAGFSEAMVTLRNAAIDDQINEWAPDVTPDSDGVTSPTKKEGDDQ